MHVHRTYHNEAGADGELPGGAAAPAVAATGASTVAAGNPDAGTPTANGAPAAGTEKPGSLMARAAGAAAAGDTPAAANPGAGDQSTAFPEKYLVKNEDGTTNWEASALKQAQGYESLAKRMGAGEAPPQTPDGYQPELPQGWDADRLKSDPVFAGFLKGAHAKGLNNAQVSYILSEFQNRMDMMRSPEVGEAELRNVWKTEDSFQAGLVNSYRGSKAFSEDDAHAQRLEQKFGNDPDFIRLMARVGKELGEDKQPQQGLSSAEAQTMEDLMAHPAYLDPKHPDHKKVVAQTSRLYQRKYPEPQI